LPAKGQLRSLSTPGITASPCLPLFHWSILLGVVADVQRGQSSPGHHNMAARRKKPGSPARTKPSAVPTTVSTVTNEHATSTACWHVGSSENRVYCLQISPNPLVDHHVHP
jgi:hypothetical protein